MKIRLLVALYRYNFISKELRNIIAGNPTNAFNYARYVIEGPFPMGEKAIATNEHFSFKYAREILKLDKREAYNWPLLS